MDLTQYINNIDFDNRNIGVRGDDYNHFCFFGITYNDKDGELKIYQNGDV